MAMYTRQRGGHILIVVQPINGLGVSRGHLVVDPVRSADEELPSLSEVADKGALRICLSGPLDNQHCLGNLHGARIAR